MGFNYGEHQGCVWITNAESLIAEVTMPEDIRVEIAPHPSWLAFADRINGMLEWLAF